LQAVLLSRQLFQKGVTSFPSNKTAAFYALLMRSGKDIPDNLSGKDCLARLKLLDEPITLDLMPRALPALLPPPRSNDQIMDDPDIDGDDAVDVPLPALRAQPIQSSTGSDLCVWMLMYLASWRLCIFLAHGCKGDSR
jgi:hypothetical protein